MRTAKSFASQGRKNSSQDLFLTKKSLFNCLTIISFASSKDATLFLPQVCAWVCRTSCWVFKGFLGKPRGGTSPSRARFHSAPAAPSTPEMKAENAGLGDKQHPKPWEENLPLAFPPLCVVPGTHDAPKPLLLLKFHSSETPGGFSPSCSTQEMHKPEVEHQAQVLAGEKGNSFIFPGVFFPLLWIHSVNYEALWPLRVSAERGKRLTHVWRGGGWSFPPLCVHRHLISELRGVFWPRRALGRCLLASSQGSR